MKPIDKHIFSETEYLFSEDFFSDTFDPEGHEDHLQRAEELMMRYKWNDVFEVWNDYLHNKCITPEAVINYCNLFSYYGGQDQFIPDPYSFVGYILYRVDLNEYWDKGGDFLDDFCTSILEKAGEISIMSNPNYQLWDDKKLSNAIQKYGPKN